jgi:hypothetical protein
VKIKTFHFIVFWLILNILQGSFTELTSDEGYYWFYSTTPQWGYYDHPPLLAWIIGTGYALFQNELGVRVVNILMSGIALFLFLKLVSPYVRNQLVLVLIILSMPLFNYLSFIVFPDGPLLFFSIVFLLAYKRFLEKKDLLSSLVMGTALALMLYSKYHAVLILLFTMVSNLKLFRSKFFYLSLAIAFILFLPHLFWQYANGYPTIKYHLSGRMSFFSINNVFQYLSQQILVIDPALIFIPFIYKPTDQFEKTLVFITVGTFIFFLVASLRAFVHFHWTSIVTFPILYLSVRFYSSRNRVRLLAWLGLPVMVLILAARIQLMIPVIPLNHVNVDYYHGRKMWANDIAKLSAGDTILFQDNFREASLFSFYSQKKGATIFSEVGRKSQYDLWHYEDSLQKKNLLYIRYEPFKGGTERTTGIGKRIYYADLSHFSSYFNVSVKASCMEPAFKNDSMEVCIEITNSRQQLLLFEKDSEGNRPLLYYKIVRRKEILRRDTLKVFSESDRLPVGGMIRTLAKIPVRNLERDRYKIIFGFQYGLLKDSENEQITIKKI